MENSKMQNIPIVIIHNENKLYMFGKPFTN